MEDTPMMKLMSLLETAIDLIFLNILWLFCCFPIVTIGAATTSMHYVARKMVENEDYHIWSDFFHSFKQNWKQGIAVEIVLAIVGGIALADFWIGTNLPGTLGVACQIIGAIMGLVWLALMTMVFPLLSRYENPMRVLLKNSVVLSLANPVIYIVNTALLVLWPVVIALNNDAFLLAIPVVILIYEALSAYVIQLLLRPVYRRMEKG